MGAWPLLVGAQANFLLREAGVALCHLVVNSLPASYIPQAGQARSSVGHVCQVPSSVVHDVFCHDGSQVHVDPNLSFTIVQILVSTLGNVVLTNV